ncbi:hypothetical protein [Marinobacterium sp. BA1]|uniref:hypothetical protein n=1 Tax=Marinobacterium sp. BA1 TaxID=3138931 RepID=UPI0032E5C1C7
MDTPFDITQKPLPAVELEQKREALTAEIAACERRLRAQGWILAALVAAVLVASSAGNAYWGWLPWSDFTAAVGAAVGAAVAFIAWFGKQRDRIDQAQAALAAHSDTDRAVCLEIKEWLEDDTIRQYRGWVQEEGRVFTRGEVEAMRAHWVSRAKRQEEAERAAAIDAACREVYVDNLVKS